LAALRVAPPESKSPSPPSAAAASASSSPHTASRHLCPNHVGVMSESCRSHVGVISESSSSHIGVTSESCPSQRVSPSQSHGPLATSESKTAAIALPSPPLPHRTAPAGWLTRSALGHGPARFLSRSRFLSLSLSLLTRSALRQGREKRGGMGPCLRRAARERSQASVCNRHATCNAGAGKGSVRGEG
jgi:hypothetical protein